MQSINQSSTNKLSLESCRGPLQMRRSGRNGREAKLVTALKPRRTWFGLVQLLLLRLLR